MEQTDYSNLIAYTKIVFGHAVGSCEIRERNDNMIIAIRPRERMNRYIHSFVFRKVPFGQALDQSRFTVGCINTQHERSGRHLCAPYAVSRSDQVDKQSIRM